jgi:hypothetical protein
MSTYFNSIQQSYNRNRALDYSNVLSVATIVNSLPFIYPIRFHHFSEEGLIFYQDKRSLLYASLISQPSEFLWQFPLTCEFYKLSGNIFVLESEKIISEAWMSLNEKEKVGYYGLPPDVLIENEILKYDINSYKPQEPKLASVNFSVIILIPDFVEHSKFLDKSAIGNTRKSYESLPQPDAVNKKWIHRLINGVWNITETQLSFPRP